MGRPALSVLVGRHGWARGVALWVRWVVFAPGSRREVFYQRWLRPVGRTLPAGVRPGELRGLTVWRGVERGAVASILVLKLDHIGDFLLAAPSFGLLRRSFPRARMTLLCGPWNEANARASGYFDEVRVLQRFAARAEEAAPVVDATALAGLGAFDLAIDLRVDEDTRPLLGWVTARDRAGFAAAVGPELTVCVAPPVGVHQREAMLGLVAAVVAAFDPAGDAAGVVERLAEGVEEAGWARPVIAMSVGSGRAIKNWPLARFVELAGALRAQAGGTLVLLGGADQLGDAAALGAALGGERVVYLVGRLTLGASFDVLRRADLFIGNDSALGHASAALGRATLVLFAGIDPLPVWAPLGARAVAMKAEVTCSPCHLSDLALCPNQHLCMTGIPVDRVLAEALRLLGSPT
jgi:ADP-heptose:LPS heptosyltransferase